MKDSKINSDENYVLNICDEVLGITSSRQHRFDFLLGDTNKNGKNVRLPVDSYYEELSLVIEYNERQHTESVTFFDKPTNITISGVSRGEQRKIYDQRRRQVLPEHNIKIIVFSYSDFKHNSQKRIIKNPDFDKNVISNKLKQQINCNHFQ